MTTKKLAGKGGPADVDVAGIIAAVRDRRTEDTPAPQPAAPERPVKTFAELKTGDWIAPNNLGDAPTAAAQVLDVHPYLDQSGAAVVLVVYTEVGEHGPQAQHLYADQAVDLATAEEVKGMKAHAARVAVAAQLRTFADLIVSRELPLEHNRMHIAESAGDMEKLAAIGDSLGVEVKNGHGRYHSVDWPKGHEAYGPGLHVTWYAYAEKEPEPATVDRDEVVDADGSVPVPADVQGVALGGGEDRPVSAPPADGGDE